ncbi:uncharacterized protein LOC134267803 [Saccostrea cucullata]|uniref:uncharacterized protein LOC134267803 n=1 Tax=Saccostrea cuccullata TaxID=36930 RepID=UPI002ECFEAC2
MASSTPSVPPCRGAPATGTTPTVSPEETNFLRFVNLVLKRAPKALRVHFDAVHPPNNLVTDLAAQRPTLSSLKSRRIINQVQWDALFGANNPMSKDFDVTLLICLIRNMSPCTPAPAGGFDVLPNPSDVSTGADLVRIKFYRNKVAHSSDAKMNINEFNLSWTDVEEAIGRLGGSALLNETKALRFSPIDESERELFLEIKRLRLKQLETVPWNVKELIEEKLLSWEKEDQVFVEIKPSTAVETFIRENPCVVVVGHPGSGKSAIIHHIALKLGREGFSIIPINRPEDILTYHNRRNPQVFVVDDPCGEYAVNDQANEWAKHSEDIKKCLNFKQSKDQVESKLLISCRLMISSTRAFRRIKIFFNVLFSLENQENHLTFNEKKQILESHVKRDLHCPMKIFEKHIDCFPLLCKFYVNMCTDPEHSTSFFENPFIQLVSKLDLLIDDPKPGTIYEYCSLVCCFLAKHKLALYLSNAEQNEDFESLYEIHNACEADINPKELLLALNRQIGKYVKRDGPTFSLIHSKLLDIIVWHFGKQSPKTLIQFSPLEIFQNRLRPLGRLKDDDIQDLFLVELDANMLTSYTKRIQKDINQGIAIDIFENHCMPNARIETCLFDLLVDGNVLNETLSKRSYNYPSSDIEANTFLSKEHFLKKGRLTFLHLTILWNWATFLEKLFETQNEVLSEIMFTQRASTIYLAVLSGNIQIVKRCFHYYSEIFDSLVEFMNFVMEHDIFCLFCDRNPRDVGHKLYCPVSQVPFPLLVCIFGNLGILEYLIQIKVCSERDFISEYRLFDETVTPLMVTSLYGHCSIVLFLLRHGASANFRNQDGFSSLHEACQEGHLEVIKTLLAFDANVNLKDNDGETPIFLACRYGFIDIIDHLLNNGAEIDLQDSQGLTPLHKSISEGNIGIVQCLIEKGCDINIASKRGDTPLTLISSDGQFDILNMFIERGMNKQELQVGMQKACEKGYKSIISTFLENGVEINSQNTQGLTPLHNSCVHDNSELVDYLFSKGAVANITSDNKQTHLHFAAKYLSEKCLSVLLEHKADINAVDDKGRTALHHALRAPDSCGYFTRKVDEEILRKIKRITDVLIENNIDLNAADIYGCSSLHKACSRNLPVIDKTLIQNEHGSSPLHLACVIGNLEIVTTLVTHGANVNIPDKTGSTSLHIAVKHEHRDVISFLIFKGANVNARDNDGCTPLILGCGQNYKDAVVILLNTEADINIEISEGLNALTIATKNHRYDICDVLFEKGAYLNEKNYMCLLQSFTNEKGISKLLGKYGCTMSKYRNKEGHSLLHLATINSKVCWVRSLLDKTELITAVDNKGQFACDYAIYNKLKSIVELFLERYTSDGNHDCVRRCMRNLMHDSFESRNNSPFVGFNNHLFPGPYYDLSTLRNSVKEVLKLGKCSVKEFINEKNLAGCTPLHYAVQNPTNISTLIAFGADIEIKDKSGRDVLHYAKACDFQKTAEILERHLTVRSASHNDEKSN